MRIAVFGASGKTGKLIVEKIATSGDNVLSLSRNPEPYEGNLSIERLELDVLSAENFTKQAVALGADQVIIALGSKELWGNRVRSLGTKNIIEFYQTLEKKPHVWVVSAAGVQESWSQLDLVSKLFAKILLPSVMKEHEKQEKIVQQSGLNYTILYAGSLKARSFANR